MVTATGIFRQPDRLAYLIASSSTWQSLCGVSSLAHAKKSVHVHSLRTTRTIDDDTTQYPRSIVSWQDADSFNWHKTGRDSWTLNGTLSMSIELGCPTQYETGSTELCDWFMNQVGAIVSEMQANAGNGEPVSGESHLNAVDFSRLDGPWEYRDDEVEILDPDNYSPQNVMWIVFSVGYF